MHIQAKKFYLFKVLNFLPSTNLKIEWSVKYVCAKTLHFNLTT